MEFLAIFAKVSPMGPNLGKTKRLEYLDSIRGLAALAVVAGHYVAEFGNPWKVNDGFPVGLWWDGQAAVCIFFVLSGYVLSLRYFREGHNFETDFNYPSYAVSRVFRIWLPYLCAVVICLALHRLQATTLNGDPVARGWVRDVWSRPLNIRWIIYDCDLLHVHEPLLLPQGWTLTIELILSLLLPAAVAIARISSGWLILAAAILFASLHASVFVLHFTAGIMLAKHAGALRSRHFNPVVIGCIIAVAAPLYGIRFIFHRPMWVQDRAWIASGVGATLLIGAVLVSHGLQRFLSLRPIAYLGRISYGVYLLHFAVLICFTPRIFPRLTFLNPNLRWVVGLLATVVISSLLAELFYRWVERPSIAIGKRIGKTIGQLTSVPIRREPLPVISTSA